jgi:hypothetical protein
MKQNASFNFLLDFHSQSNRKTLHLINFIEAEGKQIPVFKISQSSSVT